MEEISYGAMSANALFRRYSHLKSFVVMNYLGIYIYTYYKTKSSAASVCLHAKNAKTTALIFMGFSPIDRVILPENSDI